MKLVLLITILLSTTIFCKADNYVKYYTLINQAEAYCVYGDNASGFAYYDRAFKEYKRIWPQDAFIAAQFAYRQNNVDKFISYLKMAFDNQLPIEILANVPLFKKLYNNTSTYNKIQDAYKMRKIFKADSTAYDSMYSYAYKEYSLKSVMGKNAELIAKHNTVEADWRNYITTNFLNKGQLPNGFVIGLLLNNEIEDYIKQKKLQPFKDNFASTSGIQLGTPIPEYTLLSNNLALIPFLHYSCSKQEYSEQLWQAVLNGYLHPKEYGLIMEFSLQGNAVEKNCTYPNAIGYNIYDNQNPFKPQLTEVEIILMESARTEKFMQSNTVDKLKKELQAKDGMDLFFGFMDTR